MMEKKLEIFFELSKNLTRYLTEILNIITLKKRFYKKFLLVRFESSMRYNWEVNKNLTHSCIYNKIYASGVLKHLKIICFVLLSLHFSLILYTIYTQQKRTIVEHCLASQ